MADKANVILVGLSGSGKSTIGSLLAQSLNWQLLDTDKVIEAEANMDIRKLFAEYGESYFRDLEHKLVRKLKDESKQRQIIATGGGMPVYNNNLALLKDLGKVFYLKATANVIAARLIAQDQGLATRPLLASSQDEEAALGASRALSKILDERQRFYQEADIILETGDFTAQQIQEQIMTILDSEGMV